jgi:acetyltransferase-like isoleucine patch superfamily enzyme
VIRVAPTATVEDGSEIGDGTTIWDLTQIRSGARVGPYSTIGRNVYVDGDVTIGARAKIQNNALVYGPAELGNGVFVGPATVLTNDRVPRAVNPDGTSKIRKDWQAIGVKVGDGAAIGANATVVGGVRIGAWALVAAGAVVAADVPDHGLVAGVPARLMGWVGRSGERLVADGDQQWRCPVTGELYIEHEGLLKAATR